MDTPTEPNGRLTAFGNQLVEVHSWLREELAQFRVDVDAFLDGHGGEGGRGGRARKLRAHCLTFCSAVTRHHTGEGDTAFPALAKHFPELRPVLEELARDHRMVTEILRRLEELLGSLGVAADPVEPRRVRAELDGLSALLESHFRYEEKVLVSALNSLSAPRWERVRPDFLRTAAGSADDLDQRDRLG